jgi:adenylate cyclase
MAALQMNAALDPINARLADLGKDIRLQAGIGINTGPASVGNMGSRQRFAYSALGDTVNLASRLEGQTKYYGVTTLIGEDTARAVADFAVVELDLIRVKGKNTPERIFALLGDAEMAATPAFRSLNAQISAMLEAYRAGDFDRAGDLLEGLDGLEMYAAMMRARIESMQKRRPESWDGVFNAVEK